MSFPEKLQEVFDKYGTTELKIYTLLNLYDDVLAEFDKHLKEDEQFFIETTKKVREKALEDCKQKLQQFLTWLKEWSSDGIIIAKFEELLRSKIQCVVHTTIVAVSYNTMKILKE